MKKLVISLLAAGAVFTLLVAVGSITYKPNPFKYLPAGETVTVPKVVDDPEAPSHTKVEPANDSNYQKVTNADLGISFETPVDWPVEDHLVESDVLAVVDPRSRGDGVDGWSFAVVLGAQSRRFSGLLGPDTEERFTTLRATADGYATPEVQIPFGGSTLAGEQLTKVGNVDISGYPAVHFHIISGTSKEWGDREIEDGYWVRVGSKNLFFYFGSNDKAEKYTLGTEEDVIQHIVKSIQLQP